MNNKEQHIKCTLKHLGAAPSWAGYRYLVDAISAVIVDRTKLRGIIKGLYADIAQRHGVTASAVERSIRHCIAASCDNVPQEVFYEMFGNTISPDRGLPTAKCYIATVADHVIDTLENEAQLQGGEAYDHDDANRDSRGDVH